MTQLTSAKRLSRHTCAKPSHSIPIRAVPPRAQPLRQSGCSCGGGCPTCEARSQTLAGPDHPAEREADAVAARVISMPDPASVQRTEEPILMRQPEDEEEVIQMQVEDENEEESLSVPAEEELPMQAKADLVSGADVRASGGPMAGLGGGRPLPAPLRRFFEARFGQSFADVQIHDDAKAQLAARRMNAQAFTYGRDIVFGPERYAPQTASGKRLLAHELTHVVQQRRSGGGAPAAVQCALSGYTLNDCDFDAYIDIGIFAKPSLYGDPDGLNFPIELDGIATRWEAALNRLWTGPVPCQDSANSCNFTMHARVRAHPDAKFRFQVPETNKVRVRDAGYRSKAWGYWGSWAHDENDETIAHETGHLMGLPDKYSYVGAMRSYSRFVGDIMANYPRDTGPAIFGPARARIMALKLKPCPCCDEGMRRRP